MDLVRQSFSAFQKVHPIPSPLNILITQVGTYWLTVFPWTAPSLKRSHHFYEWIRTSYRNPAQCTMFADSLHRRCAESCSGWINPGLLFTTAICVLLSPAKVCHVSHRVGDTFIAVFMCHLVFLLCSYGLWLSLRHIKKKQLFICKQNQRPY